MSQVDYESRDHIAVLRLDDGKANALSHASMDALEAALVRAETEARAVVLTGRAGRFSAGFDLQEMTGGVERARALVMRGADLLLRAYVLPMPMVIACTGHALAAGALLLLTGDYRLAARGPFRIGLNEVQIGLPVPVLAMELARDRLNPMHLTAATLFATVTDPDQGLVAGWVDEVVDDADLLDRAVAQARRLAELPKDAYAKTKLALRERTVSYIRETLSHDIERLIPRA
jgi:enoyl-CoA hydratase